MVKQLTLTHKIILLLSGLVIVTELGLFLYYHRIIFDWVSHNLWIIIIPFLKTIIKKLLALQFVLFFKAAGILLLNLSKLLILKIFKTLTIRYGVFFTQRKWRLIRWCKVMFLRRGKQLFRNLNNFWREFSLNQKRFILIAFFPVVILLFLLGLSFNVTRKTMVQKTQETALFQTVVSAQKSNKGVRAWMANLDNKVLEKIKTLTLKQ